MSAKSFNRCRNKFYGLLARTLTALTLIGCRPVPNSDAVDSRQAVSALNKAFAKAPSDLKVLVEEASSGLLAGDAGKSFLQLSLVSSRPDLTAEQRGITAESMLAAGKKLQEAAVRGDKEAAQVLEAYRAAK